MQHYTSHFPQKKAVNFHQLGYPTHPPVGHIVGGSFALQHHRVGYGAPVDATGFLQIPWLENRWFFSSGISPGDGEIIAKWWRNPFEPRFGEVLHFSYMVEKLRQIKTCDGHFQGKIARLSPKTQGRERTDLRHHQGWVGYSSSTGDVSNSSPELTSNNGDAKKTFPLYILVFILNKTMTKGYKRISACFFWDHQITLTCLGSVEIPTW